MLSLNYNQRENIPMKTKKKKITICLDPQEHSTFQNRLKKERRTLSCELNNIISFMNNHKLSTNELLTDKNLLNQVL